jgi:rRNA maturation RNase YbeY
MQVEVFNAHPRRRVAAAPAVLHVRRVLRSEGLRRGMVRIVFHDDAASRRMNRTYLRHDRVTDVISFPLETRPALEGEIYVNLDQARRQADRFEVSYGNEVARLLAHGALHLAGYEDATTAGRRRMKVKEEAMVELWVRQGRKEGSGG